VGFGSKHTQCHTKSTTIGVVNKKGRQGGNLQFTTGALKMTDVKLANQVSKHEIDGHENGGQIKTNLQVIK